MKVCYGVHLFVISATCSACCEKHVRLSQSLLQAFHPFCDCLAQGQLVSAHCVISFMCVVTKKGFRFVVIHLGDLLSVSIQKRKNLYSFCGFFSVSTVFSSRTVYTERTDSTTTKWQRSCLE